MSPAFTPLKKFGLADGETAFFAETPFFEIFDLKWLAGDSKTALEAPSAIVLTKSWAEKCFDHWENAMEKTVLLDNIFPLTVKGVIADLPSNVDFNFPGTFGQVDIPLGDQFIVTLGSSGSAPGGNILRVAQASCSVRSGRYPARRSIYRHTRRTLYRRRKNHARQLYSGRAGAANRS